MSDTSDMRFSDSHEWFRVDDSTVTIGITQYAANELTDITYVETRPAGTTIDAGEAIGEVESVKTTSDVYSAVGGEIIEVNETLNDRPELINSDPFGDGWLVKIKCDDTSPLAKLMDADTYHGKYPVD